jgi:hypothetical protein
MENVDATPQELPDPYFCTYFCILVRLWRDHMKNDHAKLKMIFLAMFFLGLIGLAEGSQAATYYVDFDFGNDSNAGTSTASSWKHAPGDPNATGNPANKGYLTDPLQPGDTVLFKGGVIYKGTMSIDGRWLNGIQGKPLVYKGDGWGSEKAVLDGSLSVTGPWTKCPSASACMNNPTGRTSITR